MSDRIDPALAREVLFITYEDVIRSVKYGILKYISQEDIKKNYEKYLDYSIFDRFTNEQLLAWLSAIPEKNIFKLLATEEFDYDSSYMDTIAEAEHVFLNSFLLDIGKSLNILLSQKFIDTVYIYYPINDNRVIEDLHTTYVLNCGKIKFVYGDIREAITNIKERITAYFINDIDIIFDLVDIGKIENSQILLADYGYNYVLDEVDGGGELPVLKIKDVDKFNEEHKCYIKAFSPTLSAEYSKK